MLCAVPASLVLLYNSLRVLRQFRMCLYWKWSLDRRLAVLKWGKNLGKIFHTSVTICVCKTWTIARWTLLPMIVRSFDSESLLKIGVSMATRQEYEPLAEKSNFDSWICFSLLLFFCKHKNITKYFAVVINRGKDFKTECISLSPQILFIWKGDRGAFWWSICLYGKGGIDEKIK